jgi:hypothetical protein
MMTQTARVVACTYQFDENTLSWVAGQQPSTGGGEGAGSTQVAVSSVAGVVSIQGQSTVYQGGAPWSVTAKNSSAGDFLTRPIFSSTSADNPVSISGNSTVVLASIAATAGRIPIGSTAADNAVSISGNSTVVIASGNSSVTISAIAVGAGRINIGSTAADNAVAISGNSTAVISSAAIGWGLSGFGSKSGQAATAGDNAIVSSLAGQAVYVYAWTLTPLSTAANLVRWLSGSTTEVWRMRLLGGSTAGMNYVTSELAVSPPAYLFKTAAAAALTLNCGSSGVNYGLAYWQV